MKTRHFSTIGLIVALVLSVAAFAMGWCMGRNQIVVRFVPFPKSQAAPTNSWNPNTKVLDEGAKIRDPIIGDTSATLARDVKNFYQLLRDKQWHETYQLRAKAFRQDVAESDYLAEAKKAEKIWGLVNYEVLHCETHQAPNATNSDEAVLICKFIELPDYAESYSTVYWHREDGVWKCLSAGPFKLGIFRSLRPEYVDWR